MNVGNYNIEDLEKSITRINGKMEAKPSEYTSSKKRKDIKSVISSSWIEIHINVPQEEKETILTSDEKPFFVGNSKIAVKHIQESTKDLFRSLHTSYQYFIDDSDSGDLLDLLTDENISRTRKTVDSKFVHIYGAIKEKVTEDRIYDIFMSHITSYLESILYKAIPINQDICLPAFATVIPVTIINNGRGSVYFHDFILYTSESHLHIPIDSTRSMESIPLNFEVHFGIRMRNSDPSTYDMVGRDSESTASFCLIFNSDMNGRANVKPMNHQSETPSLHQNIVRKFSFSIQSDLITEA